VETSASAMNYISDVFLLTLVIPQHASAKSKNQGKQITNSFKQLKQ